MRFGRMRNRTDEHHALKDRVAFYEEKFPELKISVGES